MTKFPLLAASLAALTASSSVPQVERSASYPKRSSADSALLEWGNSAIIHNADGVVAGDEMDSLGTLLTTVGEPLSDDELEAFIADVDKNSDGEIGRREFMVWMRESVSDPEDD